MVEAFLEAYSQMPDPKKNSENPAFKREGKPMKYADLEAFLDVAKPILVAVGFALVQPPVNEGDRVGVHTYLQYKTGEVMDFGTFTVALAKQDPQGAGSAITYCRRYSVAAIFGLAQEDDDANGASNKPSQTAPAAQPANLATDKQVTLIFALAKDLGWTDKYLLDTIKRSINKEHPGDLTKSEASKTIDYLTGKVNEQKAADKAEDAPEPVDDDAGRGNEPADIGEDEIPF